MISKQLRGIQSKIFFFFFYYPTFCVWTQRRMNFGSRFKPRKDIHLDEEHEPCRHPTTTVKKANNVSTGQLEDLSKSPQ